MSEPIPEPIRARSASRAPRTLYWKLRPGDRVSLIHGDQIAIVTCLDQRDRAGTVTMLLEAPIEFRVEVIPRASHALLGGDRVAPRKDE